MRKTKIQLKFLKIAILVSVVFALFFSFQKNIEAAITKQINYQGKLTDDLDIAVTDGNYDMVLSIYTVASGGTPIWTARGTTGSPAARSVAVKDGLFSIMLGDTSAGDNAIGLDFNSTYYLGVTVGSDNEMTPRKTIGASGYAFNSDLLDGLNSATSGVDAHIMATDSSGNLTVSGSTYFNGTTYYINSLGTGNLNELVLAGDIDVKGGDIKNTTGALTLTPLAGNNLNVILSTTGDFAVNTNQLYVDTSVGNIGIGTTSPSQALELGTSKWLSFEGATDDNYETTIQVVDPTTDNTITFPNETGTVCTTGSVCSGYQASVSNIVTGTGTTNYLTYWTGTGTVGALTSANSGVLLTDSSGIPSWTTIVSDTFTQYALLAGRSGGQTLIGGTVADNILTLQGNSATTGNTLTNAGMQFNVGNSGGTTAMTILNNGYVGIGTASPSGPLDVLGETHLFQGTYFDPIVGTLASVKMSENASATYPSAPFTAGINGTAGANLNTYGGYFNNVSTVSGTGINYGIYAVGINNYFSGNVGIGTTTPSGTLSVVSSNTTGTTTSSALNLSANSLTTGTGLYAASSTLTSGSLIDLQVSGTAAAASQKALNILTTGANATNAITTYGGYISNTHTNATSGTNVALYLNASGATTANYGLIVNAGNVGIGVTNPGGTLSIVSANTTGTTTSSALNLSANSLTTGTGLYAASSSLTSGKLVDLQVSGTAAAASQTALNILTAGANATSGITTYGGYISNTHTNATSGTNVALYLNASGATTANYGLIVNAGRVGINNTAPGALLDIGTAGSTLGTLRLEGNTSGYVQINTAAAAGSWTMTLPANDGQNGRQLTTNGNGVTTWSAANSSRDVKDIEGLFGDPSVALNQIINTPVYNFHYKPGEGTGDSLTNYVGIMADEAPWAMHYEGTIINPVNTLGYMVLGVQALNQKISPLTSAITANNGNVGIGTSAPSQMLTIGNGTNQGNLYIANGYLCVDDNGTCGIGSPAAGSVYAVNAYTQGADYAEYFYTKDTDLKSGEAVCVDTENDKAIKRCENDGDNNIMGIVSSNPSIVGNRSEEQNNDPDHYKIIGMMGQVAGLVSAENGEIKIGDNLTASAIPGYMRKANAGESTVGVAIEDFKGVKGTIQILISRRNQSLTVEKVEETVLENIKNMNVEDQVNKIVAEAKTNLDMQIEDTNQTLQEIQDSLLQTNAEVATVQALQIKLQKQMDDITELTKTASDFIATLSISDILYKDAFGNLDLGKGKLTAAEVSAELFEVNVVDDDTSTIGEAVICPKMTEVDEDGKCTIKQVDEDEDDIDDDTDKAINNGKKIEIKTSAASEDSKIFVTAKDVTDATLAVTDINKGKGFTVEIKEPTEDAIKFDWWIVEKK